MTKTQRLTVNGVSLGDRFIDTCHRKSKIVSTVVDFIERRSLVGGDVIGYEVIASHQFMGQTIESKTLLTTVKINKIND